MKELKQAEQIRTWVQSILTDESSGHDWHHVSRVADLAAYIGEKEKRICSLLKRRLWFMI